MGVELVALKRPKYAGNCHHTEQRNAKLMERDMLTAFQGKCHTCGFDHDLLDALNTPNEGQYRAMYEAQCVATDEWAEKARKRSDPVLKERIKELEEQLAQANQTIGRLNQQLIGDVLSNLE